MDAAPRDEVLLKAMDAIIYDGPLTGYSRRYAYRGKQTMMTEEMIRERRRDLAQQLLQLQAEYDSPSHQFEQLRHWLYCLSEVLGDNRNEDFWAWVQRMAA